MKYLLAAINAKYIHSSPAVWLLQGSVPQKFRSLVQIAEYTINEYPSEILAKIYREKPDVLAISCYIWNERTVDWLLPELAKILPDTAIWLGGPEVCYNAEETLRKYPAVTGVMTGEGDVSFPGIVEAYEKKAWPLQDLLMRVPGLLFRQTDGISFSSLSEMKSPIKHHCIQGNQTKKRCRPFLVERIGFCQKHAAEGNCPKPESIPEEER